MLEYIIIFVVTLLCAIEFDYNRKNLRLSKYLYWIICLYLIILIGIRYKVGGDTINYMEHWQWLTDLDNWSFTFISKFAPGFSLLCSLCKTLNEDYFFFQFIHSLIFNCALFIFINKYSKFPFTTLLVIYFVLYLYFATEILREALAVLVFSFSINYFIKREWICFYIFVFIAFLFHVSAVFLIFLPALRNIRFSKNYIIVYIFFGICLIFLKRQFTLLSNVPIIGETLVIYITDNSQGLLADFMNYLRLSFFPMFFILFMKNQCRITSKYEVLIAIMCLFGIGTYVSPVVFQRLCNYFLLIESVVFADLFVRGIKAKQMFIKHNIAFFFIAFVLLFGSEFILYRRYSRWIPYSSIYERIEIERDNYNNLK